MKAVTDLGVCIRGVDPEDLHAQVLSLQDGGLVEQLSELRGEEVASHLHVDGGSGRQGRRPTVLSQHSHLHSKTIMTAQVLRFPLEIRFWVMYQS